LMKGAIDQVPRMIAGFLHGPGAHGDVQSLRNPQNLALHRPGFRSDLLGGWDGDKMVMVPRHTG
jgi:hypothetical protein